MTAAYILDPVTRATIGVVDQSYASLDYTRRYWGTDSFDLLINRRRLYASELTKGRMLYLPDEGDLIFLIEQIASTQEGSQANDQMRVAGRSLEGIVTEERLAYPAAGDSHDRQTAVPAETAMRYYVNKNAGPLAVAARQIPSLTIPASAGVGGTMSYAARYQLVAEVLSEIGLTSGLGWQITFDRVANTLVFNTVEGVDRTTSVFFDFDFETLEKWEELISILDSKTFALVAGQGEGVDREIVERYTGAVPTGLDRREAFIDARDVEPGQTALLQARGDAFLATTEGETRFEARIHQHGSFRYREHWDIGDIILVRNEPRGISLPARVVEVTKRVGDSEAASQITVSLDRPFPTLRDRLSLSSGAGRVDSPLTLPPDPHAAAHSVGGADPLAGALGGDTLRLESGSGAALASTAHGLQIGPTDSTNLIIDNNEIMVRNNGAAATMYLQNDGGADVLAAAGNIALRADGRIDHKPVGAFRRNTASQNIINASWQRLTMNTTDWEGLDTDISLTYVRVRQSGLYVVEAMLEYPSTTGGTWRLASIGYGTGIPGSGETNRCQSVAADASDKRVQVTSLIRLPADYYVSGFAYQNSGGTLSISRATFAIVRVGSF